MVMDDESLLQRHLVKMEKPLAFANSTAVKRRPEDPISHRIIEKRRRDRMNNCLADLSKLIPSELLKKGRGRIEKTEIIEMAIKHMKYLQSISTNDSDVCNAKNNFIGSMEEDNIRNKEMIEPIVKHHYELGFHECMSETMHFLLEMENVFSRDSLVKLISHLRKHCCKVLKEDRPNIVIKDDKEYKLQDCGYSSMSSDTGDQNLHANLIFEDHHDEPMANSNQLRSTAFCTANNVFIKEPKPNIEHQLYPEMQSHADAGPSTQGQLFKFKNYIKERFSAERTIDGNETMDERCKVRRSVIHSVDKVYFNEETQMQAPFMKTSSETRAVPIFALHRSGSYYVPLTIDSSVLGPIADELNTDSVMDFPTLALHPVTISVNFQRSVVEPPMRPVIHPSAHSELNTKPAMIMLQEKWVNKQ